MRKREEILAEIRVLECRRNNYCTWLGRRILPAYRVRVWKIDQRLEELRTELANEEERQGSFEQLGERQEEAAQTNQFCLEEELTRLQDELTGLRRAGVLDCRKVGEVLGQLMILRENYPRSQGMEAFLREVKACHDEARAAEGRQVTAFQAAEFEALIREYEGTQQRGEERVRRLVPEIDEDGRLVFGWSEELGRELIRLRPLGEEWIDPGQAIAEVRQHATAYAWRKGREKLSLAQESLPENPRQAEQLVQEALGLFLLPDRPREELETFREEQLRPALELREKAEAMRDTALREVDIVTAWRQLAQAVELDPSLPREALLRGQLHSRLEVYLEKEFSRAQMARRQQDWTKARELAASLLALVTVDAALGEWKDRLEGFLEDCIKLERRDGYYRETIKKIADMLEQDSLQAAEELRLLEEELEEGAEMYPELSLLRSQVSTRVSLESLLDEADRVWNAGNQEEMARMVEELQEAREQTGHSRPVRRRMQEWSDRLDARYVLRECERNGGGMDPQDLRQKLQRVIDLTHDQGEDAQKAAELLDRMKREQR